MAQSPGRGAGKGDPKRLGKRRGILRQAWWGLVLMGSCALPRRSSSLPGEPGSRIQDPRLPFPDRDPFRPFREAASPWGALTLQGPKKVSRALGERPFSPEPSFPSPPGTPEEEWLLRRGGHLVKPLADHLGLDQWFRKRALTFDGKSLHTPLQDWISRLTGGPSPRKGGAPPLMALNFQGSSLVRRRSPFTLVLRPSGRLRIQWNDRRGGLRWTRPLNGTWTAEGGISIRNARLARPSSCLGLRAELPSGWIFRVRLGTDIGPSTLDIPWEAPRPTAPGMALALGIRF